MRKVAPPYRDTRAGNSQMLPMPTAEPMQARIKPHLEPQESRLVLCVKPITPLLFPPVLSGWM